MAVAVAVFQTKTIVGEAVATLEHRRGVTGTRLRATFTALPPGLHGFHIHVNGDLRGEGCKGACKHFHKGTPKGTHSDHGGAPGSKGPRHTGDLGNICLEKGTYRYFLPGVTPDELWGRTLIVHDGEDDLGKGGDEESKVTGNSGARIGCAVFGRGVPCATVKKTRRRSQRV